MSSDYRPAIERVLGFVAQHLDRPLSVREVARVAHLSEFHFHRIFAAVMNESVGRYITRKRLEVAALRIAYERHRTITSIALSSGYSSTSNFSKAFAGYFGVSPSRVRHPDGAAAIGNLTSQFGHRFNPQDLHVLPPDADNERRVVAKELAKNLRFETIADLHVACLASPEGYDLQAVMNTWNELIDRVQQLGISGDAVDAYGMAHDSPVLTAPERCRYHACVPCDPNMVLPAPLFRSRIPEGRYAVFRYAGAVENVEQVYRAIYSVWLPESSVAPDDFVPIDHYINDEPIDGHADFEIWIKVRSRTAG